MFNEENVTIDDSIYGEINSYTEEPYVSIGSINESVTLAPTGAKESAFVTSVTPVTQEELNESLKKTAETVQQTLDCFEEDSVSEAKETIDGFTKFIASEDFKNAIHDASRKSGIPPKKLANSFFGKVAGSIGDMLGITIDIIDSGANTLIDLLTAILRGSVSGICKVARFLARLFTFNKTNKVIL